MGWKEKGKDGEGESWGHLNYDALMEVSKYSDGGCGVGTFIEWNPTLNSILEAINIHSNTIPIQCSYSKSELISSFGFNTVPTSPCVLIYLLSYV